MATYLIQRIAQGTVVLFLVSLVTFMLINLAPGGPSSLVDFTSTAAERDARLAQYGLDRPAPERYVRWLSGVVLRGDLGTSINQGLPVTGLLRQRLGATLKLAFTALTLAVTVGLLLGIIAALWHNRWPDHVVSALSTAGMSIPNFWLGMLAIIIFAVRLRWLPASGVGPLGQQIGFLEQLRYLAMPASVLAFSLLPNVVRVARAGLLDVLGTDYIRTARAKGLAPRVVVSKHALRNALVPVVAIVGLITTVLFSGSVVIESVFGWPGLGRLAIEAANGRDFPVILGVTLLAGAVVVIVNLIVDLLYAIIDPTIRHD